MGLPDFLKFAVRSAPDSLVPVTELSENRRKIEFDFALVDATNAAQTIGFDRLFHLFALSNILIKVAVVFAVDSQREGRDAARRFRQSRSIVGDLDVQVKSFCTRLANEMAKLGKGKPLFLMSGRGIAGEADYKILDLHRAIVSTAMHYEKPSPTFLFVSEDSDILCGTLCGPSPQNVSIATTLHDTTFKMNILRVSFVTTYVAACVDAIASESEVPPSVASLGNETISPNLVKPDPLPIGKKVEESTLESVSKEKEEKEEDVVRRKKKDGPMIATGIREVLSDSDSGDDDEAKKKMVPQDAHSPTSSSSSASNNEVPITLLSENLNSTYASSMSVAPVIPCRISALDLSAGWITYFSCVDLVFLFQLIMGNGDTVPPLVRGATKIDIQSCWSAYCRHKYEGHTGSYGRQLLRIGPASEEDLEGTMVLDTAFLYYILDAVHYTDGVARPPTSEERNRVVEFLSAAISSTVRYMVGCNVQGGDSGSMLRETILDSRPSSHAPFLSPSIAAVRWVLESGPSTLSFKFSLDASGKQEEETPRTKNSSSALSSEVYMSLLSSFTLSDTRHGAPAECDVGAHLASLQPFSFSKGFVEERPKVVHIDAVVQQHLLVSASQRRTSSASVGKKIVASWNAVVKAIPDTPSVYSKDVSALKVFPALVRSWAHSIAQEVQVIRRIGSASRFISPATGRMVVGPLSTGQHVSSGKEQSRTLVEAPMTYSFELRRMIPVASSTVASPYEEGKKKDDDSTSSRAALLRALGISFSYAEEPEESSTAAKKAESAILENDPPKKKRREEVRSIASPEEGTGGEQTADGKKKSHPGKKERMKKQSAMKSSV